MSDKSRDVEPEHEETVPGEADAAAEAEGQEQAIPDEASANDEAIAELEQGFSAEEQSVAGAITRKTAKAPVRKDSATRKRSEAEREHEDPYKAHNPFQFAKQSGAELKKVVWPTWPQTVTMFSAVLIFVLIMILIVGLLTSPSVGRY